MLLCLSNYSAQMDMSIDLKCKCSKLRTLGSLRSPKTFILGSSCLAGRRGTLAQAKGRGIKSADKLLQKFYVRGISVPRTRNIIYNPSDVITSCPNTSTKIHYSTLSSADDKIYTYPIHKVEKVYNDSILVSLVKVLFLYKIFTGEDDC